MKDPLDYFPGEESTEEGDAIIEFIRNCLAGIGALWFLMMLYG